MATPPLPPLRIDSNGHRRPGNPDSFLHATSPHRSAASPHSVRPVSPYTFGNAPLIPHDNSANHLRSLLRSPPHDSYRNDGYNRALSGPPEHPSPPDESRDWVNFDGPHSPGGRRRPSVDADNDIDMRDQRKGQSERSSSRDDGAGAQFDYSMRRHSIAAVQSSDPSNYASSSADRRRNDHPRTSFGPAASQSLKRKISHDRAVYSTLGEETDQLSMVVDAEEPAPKRRGSAFDTRIAQLSLYDRRDSLDSRSPSSSQAWAQERRDSTSSMLSAMSSGASYGSSGFPGDSHVKNLPGMPWPSADAHNEADPLRAFDPPRGSSTSTDLPSHSSDSRQMPSLSSLQALSTDRRMSAPEPAPRAMERVLRSRSRPSSSRGASNHSEPPELPALKQANSNDSTPSPMPDPNRTDSSGNPNSLQSSSSQATPYSRSPELRVSHKLAERKRRKEMKDLFDELRDQLPADRGMKASKWEILSKAVDYIQHLKTSQHDLHREIDMLRHEVDAMRAATGQYAPVMGGPQGVPHPGVVYPQGPALAPYPPGTQGGQPRGNVVSPYGGSPTQASQGHKSTTPM